QASARCRLASRWPRIAAQSEGVSEGVDGRAIWGQMKHGTLDRSSSASPGLRTLAVFEVAKGAIVLLLACGVLPLIHKNLDEMASRVARLLHVNPEGKLSNLFIELASHATDRTLWVLALAALVYAAVR